MRCGVVVFPASNCDHDAYHVLKHVLGADTVFLWHADETIRGCDLVVLPGGFAYGDYLRAGALAAVSPIMKAIREHADAGGLVLGICNGFQVLTESGLLPGALCRNTGLRFICKEVGLRVERTDLPFTRRYGEGASIRLPIAHAQGCYTADAETLASLEANRQVVFRYAGEGEDGNPNGSANAIAGVVNRSGNVLGLMPHPERAAEEVLGNTDGLAFFEGLLNGTTFAEALA
jgi:phosphoribosylformylglycinamidine synthase subunit PurQ / glutaminase